MITTYHINADELNFEVLEGIKNTFKNKNIQIVVFESDDISNFKNSNILSTEILNRIDDIENKKNLIVPDQIVFQ
jgi:antitoxin YefM